MAGGFFTIWATREGDANPAAHRFHTPSHNKFWPVNKAELRFSNGIRRLLSLYTMNSMHGIVLNLTLLMQCVLLLRQIGEYLQFPQLFQLHCRFYSLASPRDLWTSIIGISLKYTEGLPWWLSGQESACQCRGHEFDPWSRNKDPTSCRATKPKHHNYWAWALEPRCRHYWSPCAPGTCCSARGPPKWEACAQQLERSPACRSWRKPGCSSKKTLHCIARDTMN